MAVTIDTVRSELRAHYPTLHAYVNDHGQIEIAGAYPVLDVDDEVIDRFCVSITLPDNYPNELPIVREVGRRIPCVVERHVHACVFRRR